MKKTLAYLLLFIMVAGIMGCGSGTREGKVNSFDDLDKVPGFACKDLDGNMISNDIFAGSKLTLLNIWTTG